MIGIIILNYITWSDTASCIHSIWESESEGTLSYHIYVVDNATPGHMPEEIKALFSDDRITYIQSKKNLGYAAGNNLGIRQAEKDGCDFILISNSDVTYEKNCIRQMKQYLDEHRQVGIVGPKILDKDGIVQKSCMCRRTGLKEKYLVRTRLNVLFRRQYRTYFGLDRDYDTTFPVHAVLGCCFMISGKCAREVFPFDEGTFLYEEEYIVGIRMEEKGYETHYYPQAVIHHLHGNSTAKVKPFSYTCECISELYYCRKYLRAENWQIRPLYIYRIFKYNIKCICNKSYRTYRKEFYRQLKQANACRRHL